MSFNNRSEFITAQSSEKVIIAHVHAKAQLFNWSVFSGNIYQKTITQFPIELKKKLTTITQVFSIGGLLTNTWFYEPSTAIIYVNLGGLVPDNEEMVVQYRFFWANGPVTMSWDLTNSGDHVYYDGRIKESPSFKHKVGVDQKLVSVIGQGSLKLQNNDGSLDEIYDTLFFENQDVLIYSWNRELQFSEAKIIYRGKITNKLYNSTEILFKVKDTLYNLLQNVPQIAYDENDNVNTDIQGRYKRWIYGRVDGLKLQSIQQIGEGYNITGTVSAGAAVTTLTGVGTTFLSETSVGDKITMGTQEFNIESIESDTSLTLDNATTFSFTGQTAQLKPDVPVVTKNREFFVAGHACAKITKTVVNSIQLNRVILNDTVGIESGDFVEFLSGERVEIKNVAPGNVIVLRQNLITLPTIGSNVVRQPIQNIFIKEELVDDDKFTITNTGGSTKECKVTLDSDAEFQIAKTQSLGFSGTFTNGTRVITTTDNIDLTETLKPRDYIKPNNIAYTTFYEILRVEQQTVTIRTAFVDPTIVSSAEGKLPDYVGDDTIVSANVLGKTVDGEPEGLWLQTSAQVVRDLLTEISVPNVNESSFTTAGVNNSALVSMALPLSVSGTQPTTKTVIDLLSKSTSSALTLDNNLDLQYINLLPRIPDAPIEISDNQVVSWSVQSVNGELIRNTLVRYRHKDIDRFTQEAGNLTKSFSSDFVETFIGTNNSSELDVYLYNDQSAETIAHREIYFRSLARAQVTIRTDLRFEDVNIGDFVIVNFKRLYKRFGDSASRKKVCIVVGKTVTGDSVELFVSDIGNIINRSSIITPNGVASYSAATEDEKLKYGYITDERGITNNDEDTTNINLIS